MRGAAALWLAAFACAALVGTHGIAYWDAGDYVRLAITGGESGLLLGRPLFLLISRLVLAAGVEPASAEIVLRWFWTAAGATAAPLLALLASRLGADRSASFLAGLMLALSPSFAHTSHQVLTDAGALALTIAALCLAAQRRGAAAGLVLAAAVGMRETALVHLIGIAWLCGRRAWLPVVVCAAGIGATIWLTTPPAMGNWIGAMSTSARANPLTVADVGLGFVWMLAAGPLPVLAGAAALVRTRFSRDLTKVAWPAATATVALLFYPDGSFSPRYMLATVPIAFFIPAAIWLKTRTTWVVQSLVVAIFVALFAVQPANRAAAYGATLSTRVSVLPQHAFVVPGHFCPQAKLAATIHQRDDLMFVCPGWEWPVDVPSLLDSAVANGSIVAVDASADAWVGRREQPLRAVIRAWLAGRDVRELAGFSIVSP